MKLSLISIEKEGYVRLANDGSITGEDVIGSTNAFESVLGASWATTRVLLDFGRTPFVDSSAIGWLIGSQRTFNQNGGKLVLHSVVPSVGQVFSLLKIHKLLPIGETEEAGRTLLIGGAK